MYLSFYNEISLYNEDGSRESMFIKRTIIRSLKRKVKDAKKE